MPKFLNPLSLASTGFSLAAAITLLAAASPAEAASKRLCEYNNPKRTMSCCEAYLRKSLDNRGNSGLISCNARTQIVCKQSPSTHAGGAGKLCYVVLKQKPWAGGGNSHQPPSQGNRNGNTPGASGGNGKP